MCPPFFDSRTRYQRTEGKSAFIIRFRGEVDTEFYPKRGISDLCDLLRLLSFLNDDPNTFLFYNKIEFFFVFPIVIINLFRYR